MKDKDIVFGMAHEARRQIIHMLKGGKKRHLELCRMLDISPPEVTRHCRILTDMGIIQKNSKSFYEITNTGRHLAIILNNIEFMNLQMELINEHDFDMIPGELDTISILGNTEIIEGPMNVLDRMRTVNNQALDSINCIFEETIDHIVMEHVEQLKRGIRINILIKDGSRIPREYIESSMLGLEIRKISEIPLGMVASESGAMIIPRHRRGILDYGFGFMGQGEFLRYCDYIFSYFWEQGKVVIL